MASPAGEVQDLCLTYFATHDVFRADEFRTYLAARDVRSARPLLNYYVSKRQVWRMQPGVYASVRPKPVHQRAVSFALPIPLCVPEWAPASVDPCLAASKMTPDATLSHHTALESHGCAHNMGFRLVYTAHYPRPDLRLRGGLVRGTRTPESLLARGDAHCETLVVGRYQQRITTLERTLVDILDRPYLCGDWEDLGWAYADAACLHEVDLPRLIAYALRLNHPFTCVKAGYFLELYQTDFDFDPALLNPLRAFRPRRTRAFDPEAKRCGVPHAYVADWNLHVPIEIQERTWELY